MRKIIICLALIQLSSCQQIAKMATGFKNPKIENTNSIKTFMEENELDKGINLMSKDKKSYVQLLSIFNKKLPEAVLFDRNGDELLYKENAESCNAGLFKILPSLMPESTLKKGEHNLTKLINNYTTPLSGTLPQVDGVADFYLVINWAKFVGKKNKDHVLEWEKLAQNNSKTKIKVIKLNMDFREGWDLTNEDIKIR